MFIKTHNFTATALVKNYRSAGADSFFHLPVVLFGGYDEPSHVRQWSQITAGADYRPLTGHA